MVESQPAVYKQAQGSSLSPIRCMLLRSIENLLCWIGSPIAVHLSIAVLLVVCIHFSISKIGLRKEIYFLPVRSKPYSLWASPDACIYQLWTRSYVMVSSLLP